MQHMVSHYLMHYLWFNHELTKRVYYKCFSGLVLIKYISEPIYYLYKVGSTSFSLDVSTFLQFMIMGVEMALQSSIPNLFKISMQYFP